MPAVGWRFEAPAGGGLTKTERQHIFYAIAAILVTLWLLGLITSYRMGGVIHVLLVVAIVMVLASFIFGRKQV